MAETMVVSVAEGVVVHEITLCEEVLVDRETTMEVSY